MANTSDLKMITQFALEDVSKKIGTTLRKKKIALGEHHRIKSFSGISDDGSILIKVINQSGYTSGGKRPVGKIRSVYSDCYFMSLSKAKQKILVFTNEEFYKIFCSDSQGLLPGFELYLVTLPQELKEIAQRVTGEASKEMTKDK